MDLLIAANTVAQDNADVAPATGTGGWATDGNPAANKPATQAPAWHYNMMMAEMLAIIKAAGITASNADWSQVLKAMQTIFAPAQRGVAPYSASLSTLIGGYPKSAVVVDATGNFWVSMDAGNLTVPGADGATWQSLFNGYATETWANGQFLQLSDSEEQTVTGLVSFNGKTTVPSVTDWASKQAVPASDANKAFVKNNAGTSGGITALDLDGDGSGRMVYLGSDGLWHPVQNAGECPKFSDFVSGWGLNGYIEIPTSSNWKLVIQWVQFQGVTGPGGNNGAGRYETEDIFVTWPLGMGNLFSISGLAVEDVGGVGMQEQVWKMINPTATGGSFRMACNASGMTMNGSAVIFGGVAA